MMARYTKSSIHINDLAVFIALSRQHAHSEQRLYPKVGLHCLFRVSVHLEAKATYFTQLYQQSDTRSPALTDIPNYRDVHDCL